MSTSVEGRVDRPRSLAGRLALAVVALTIAGIAALLIAVTWGQGEYELHPWWELPSLGVLLLAPYAIALYGLSLKDRDPSAGGLALVVAGLTSVVPALLLLTVLVGLELLMLGVVLVVLGLHAIWLGRRRPTLFSVIIALAAVVLVIAAAPARLAGDQARCLRWTRYADGREVREEYTPVVRDGMVAVSPQPPEEGASSGTSCTSDYTSAAKAAASTFLALGGVALALTLPAVERRGRRTNPR